MRRLTIGEYGATVVALLGVPLPPGTTFPPDARQSGFARNDAQVVDTVWATAAASAAEALSQQAVQTRLNALAPCATGTAPLTCATGFIEDFGARAFRRPLTADERTGLSSVYQTGATGGTYASGVGLVIRAVLQAPAFLYLTELGSPMLTDWELASALSYLFSGGPPDDALRAVAAAGTLQDPAVREAQARRLLALNPARAQLQALTIEWLGLDRIASLAKDSTKFPNFDATRTAAMAEARAFVDEVFFGQHGGVSLLLGADFTVTPQGKTSLAGTQRRGVLTTPAFLASYSNPSDSGPIHRGAALVRKVLCQTLPDPSDVGLQVTPPPPDPTRTTRERFSAHVASETCRSCHKMIDPAGFAFEHFDAAGGYRTLDNGKTVDSSGELKLGDVAGPFTDHLGLISKLEQSEDVRRCFARNVYRFSAAQTNTAGEMAFLDRTLDLTAAQRGDPLELLVAIAGSELFAKRSITP